MSTFGIELENNNGQVLISSNSKNLHLVAKLFAPTQVMYSEDGYGGIRILRYRVSCSLPPCPFFTMPSQSDFYGLTRITSPSTGLWDIEIIKSGSAANFPEVYVFAEPGAQPEPTEEYGLAVYNEANETAFDSRLLPLVVTGGVTTNHPTNPKTSYSGTLSAQYCGSSGSGYFAPNNYNTFEVGSMPSKPMFLFTSLAQAEREATFSASEEECDGVPDGYGGCAGAQRIYTWVSTYWAFYRGAIRRTTTSIQAGWATASYGCNWTYQKESTLIGIGTGGTSGQGGSWPYSNETLNLGARGVVISDAAIYD